MDHLFPYCLRKLRYAMVACVNLEGRQFVIILLFSDVRVVSKIPLFIDNQKKLKNDYLSICALRSPLSDY